jgi:hypothetical protein
MVPDLERLIGELEGKAYHGEPPVRDPELGVGALPVEPEHGVEVGARSCLLVLDVAALTGSHVGWRRRAEAAALLDCSAREEAGCRVACTGEGEGVRPEANKQGRGEASGASCLAGLRFHAKREGSRSWT